MKVHETLPLVPIARGNGSWLYDFDGGRYLDAVSSWWVNLFGHANSRINAALVDQLGTLDHVMLAGFTHQPVVELSERPAALAPSGLGHGFYGSDRPSAVESRSRWLFTIGAIADDPEDRIRGVAGSITARRSAHSA
jgi:adenosylmethionine-8-amino-7-oxononanoate aminotransferase